MKGAQTVGDMGWEKTQPSPRGRAWLGLPYAEHKDARFQPGLWAQPGEAASDGAQC